MACTVGEISPWAVGCQNLTRGSIRRAGFRAHCQSLTGGLLRLQNSPVPPPDPLRCAPEEDRARHIATVAAEYSTQVQDYQFILLEAFSRGMRVRVRPTAAGCHDRFE